MNDITSVKIYVSTISVPIQFYSNLLKHIYSMKGVHKVSFPLVPQLVNHLLREATEFTW